MNALPVPGDARSALPDLDLQTVRDAVEPIVQRTADRGWSLADFAWDSVRPELLTDADRSAVRFVTYIEDHIPGYLTWLLERFPVDGADGDPRLIAIHREYFRFFVVWACDEERHAAALTRYQEASGISDASRLRSELAVQSARPFDLPYREPLEMFTYTMLQEKAAQLFYRQFRNVVAEPLLRGILLRLARDEARHFSLYSRLVEEYLQRDSTAALPHLKEVLATFRMPLADTLPRYRRWSDEVAATAGYDYTEAFTALLRLIDQHASAPGKTTGDDLARLLNVARSMP